MAKLIMVSGGVRKEFELGPVNTIGRHPGNSVQILDRIISKEHAQVLRQPDGRFLLRDLGSLNGTYLGNVRIGEHILKHGDEITLGSTRLVFSDQPEEESLNRVTISAGSLTETHIQHRVDAERSQNFLPAKSLPVEELRRDYEKLRMAHELGRAIVGILDLETLLPKILDKSFELLPADRGVILLMQNGQLVPRYVKHKDPRLRDEQIVLSNSIIHEVTLHKKAVLSSDATMDSRFSGAHSIIMQGIRSTMSVPLMQGNELLGVMYLDSQIATNAFTEKDLQLFSSIANQAAVAIQNARLAKKIEEEARTRAQFERLLSPNLVKQIVSGELHLDQKGVRREVTILFSDIRGFTSLSERSAPEDVVALLNEYFELMIKILFQWEGTLDKYVGDEIMALFGAPVPQPDATWRAVQCAIEMQQALREFNQTREAEGLQRIEVGIGINTGTVVTGAIGSTQTKQYTAIGDAVNTAARLCSLAGPGQIIISESTLNAVRDRVDFCSLQPVRVKGKQEPLQIYSVLGRKTEPDVHTDRTRPG
ncbi:MAG: adenylate/guanylate cyclase domain-containing protein [Myxococcales bacterium]|nr:FHA domain-containing protein [Myxococcota bacterium]MDW8282111.1 adenylate/guanylate cyclase domain-containing protein [Myxococcales bacterium]